MGADLGFFICFLWLFKIYCTNTEVQETSAAYPLKYNKLPTANQSKQQLSQAERTKLKERNITTASYLLWHRILVGMSEANIVASSAGIGVFQSVGWLDDLEFKFFYFFS